VNPISATKTKKRVDNMRKEEDFMRKDGSTKAKFQTEESSSGKNPKCMQLDRSHSP
jgi:hypothetical protein